MRGGDGVSDKEKREQLIMEHGDETDDVIPSCGPNFGDHRWGHPDLDFDGDIEWVVGVSTCWKCGMEATERWRMRGSPEMTDPFEGVRHPLPDDGPIEIEEVKA